MGKGQDERKCLVKPHCLQIRKQDNIIQGRINDSYKAWHTPNRPLSGFSFSISLVNLSN